MNFIIPSTITFRESDKIWFQDQLKDIFNTYSAIVHSKKYSDIEKKNFEAWEKL
jgi:hypothetical protein